MSMLYNLKTPQWIVAIIIYRIGYICRVYKSSSSGKCTVVWYGVISICRWKTVSPWLNNTIVVGVVLSLSNLSICCSIVNALTGSCFWRIKDILVSKTGSCDTLVRRCTQWTNSTIRSWWACQSCHGRENCWVIRWCYSI